MHPKDAVRYHELRAVHLRELAERATTHTIKQWLLEQAEEHEQIAASGEGLVVDEQIGSNRGPD